MNCGEKWNLIFSILTAIGTVGAVIVALFGDYFKNILFKAKISVQILNTNGELTYFSIIPLIPAQRGSDGSQTTVNYHVETHITTAAVEGVLGYYPPAKSPTPTPTGTSGYGSSGSPSATGPSVIYYHLRIVNRRKSIDVKKCRVSLKEVYIKNNEADNFINLPLTVPPKFFWAPADFSPQSVDIVTDQVLDFGFIRQDLNIFTPAIWPRFNNFKGDIEGGQTFKYVLEIIADNLSPKKVTLQAKWNGLWSENLNEMAANFQLTIITNECSKDIC